jgi:PAS domain S-box-containing protein
MEFLRSEHANALAAGLFDAVPGGLVLVRLDGSIAAANAEALRLLERSHEELTRTRTSDFASATVSANGAALPLSDFPVTKVLQTGQAQPATTLGVHTKHGRITWLVLRALPVKDPHSQELSGAIVSFLDITERKLAEDELQRSRDMLRKSQQLARVGTWEWDLSSNAVRWTDQLYEIHGIEKQQFHNRLQDSLAFVHPDDRERIAQRTAEMFTSEVPLTDYEYRIIRPDGTERTLWGSAEVIRDAAGRPIKAIGAIQDITERQQLEMQLHQMQRLESVGQLAGGIAHDFNNLLQPIIINADMILLGTAPAGPVAEIKLAARRGADLTQRLLAFGQRQPFRPVPVDLNQVIEPFVGLLRRTLGERVVVEIALADSLPAVLGDRSQLEQVLMNLAVNARDAMPDGGRLTIRTRKLVASDVAELQQLKPEWRSPHCVEVTVSDSGAGMSSKVLARAFEPFFTTKDVGAGSGLGLSVVYGIVQEHDGRIMLESRPGQGSTFRIFLPTTTQRVMPAGPPGKAVVRPGQAETILVVEDDAPVRRSTIHVLEASNYRVLSAEDGEAALLLFLRNAERISLVLTDMVMPGRSGADLVREIRWHRPQMRVLYMTGYAPDETGEDIHDPILHKPYETHELLIAVRAALEAPLPGVTLLRDPHPTHFKTTA